MKKNSFLFFFSTAVHVEQYQNHAFMRKKISTRKAAKQFC